MKHDKIRKWYGYEEYYPSLALVRYMLPFTPVNSYLTKRGIFFAISGNISVIKNDISRQPYHLCILNSGFQWIQRKYFFLKTQIFSHNCFVNSIILHDKSLNWITHWYYINLWYKMHRTVQSKKLNNFRVIRIVPASKKNQKGKTDIIAWLCYFAMNLVIGGILFKVLTNF